MLRFCLGFSELAEAALCGCDLFPCVESGQYDPRAVEEGDPRAEASDRQSRRPEPGSKARRGEGRGEDDHTRRPDWELPMQVTVKGKNTAVPEKLRARA